MTALTPSVAVVGRGSDPHAAAVARLAGHQGAKVTVIDTGSRSFSRWGWRVGQLYDHHGERVTVDAAYVRSVAIPLPVHDVPVVEGPMLSAWLVQAERRRRRHLHARSLHAGLETAGALVVNSVDTTWFHRSKPAADLRLRAAGIPAPRSLVTDDPTAVRTFVDTVGEVVRKPVGGGGACVAVAADDLTDAALAGLATAPMLFQERVRGEDLRVYVAGGEVLAGAHIQTTALDYRGHEDDVTALAVDEDLADLSLRAAAALGMDFSGIDVKRASDGSLTVLDVNPSPMFLGIERRTRQPITERLVARLVAGASGG